METTTLKIHFDTKRNLDLFREYRNESYDEVIRKLLYIVETCKTQPKLSINTIRDIEKARLRIKSGKFLTEEETKKRLRL